MTIAGKYTSRHPLSPPLDMNHFRAMRSNNATNVENAKNAAKDAIKGAGLFGRKPLGDRKNRQEVVRKDEYWIMEVYRKRRRERMG